MRRLWTCRRTFVAVFSISVLAALCYFCKIDVAGSIAAIALSVCAANAAQASFEKKYTYAEEPDPQPPKTVDLD